MKPTGQSFLLVLKPVPNWRYGSPTQRLKIAIKALLRGYGLRVAILRPIAAEDFLPWFEKEAKERLRTSTGGSNPQPREKIPYAEKGKATERAAEAFKVSNLLTIVNTQPTKPEQKRKHNDPERTS